MLLLLLLVMVLWLLQGLLLLLAAMVAVHKAAQGSILQGWVAAANRVATLESALPALCVVASVCSRCSTQQRFQPGPWQPEGHTLQLPCCQ